MNSGMGGRGGDGLLIGYTLPPKIYIKVQHTILGKVS